MMNTWGQVSISLELNAIIQEFLIRFPFREKLWFHPKSHQNQYKNGTFRYRYMHLQQKWLTRKIRFHLHFAKEKADF